MSFTVQNKIALVTGANRGIGRTLVDTLFAHGATKVYAAVRNPESASELVLTYGERVVPLRLDLTDAASIQQAAEEASDAELVINNAGVLRVAKALDPNAEEALRFELEGNVFGLLRVAQAFAPVLAKNGGGAFVQLNSIVSQKSFSDFATYSASKAAAYSLTQALHWDLSQQGTQVVSVHPGPIATDMGDAAGLTPVAESPTLVGDAILRALEAGELHAWAGTSAEQIGAAYQGFAKQVVEAALSEA